MAYAEDTKHMLNEITYYMPTVYLCDLPLTN